jgi:hypothetical protein
MKALDTILKKISFSINNEEKLKELSDGFAQQLDGVLEGCVMAVDGIAIKTRQPKRSEVSNINCYRNRKGGFAIVVMAVATLGGNFILLQPIILARRVRYSHGPLQTCMMRLKIAKCSTINISSLVMRHFLARPNFYLLGLDEIGKHKDSFNYWLSHSRRCIESAFGLLIQRWGIFWRELKCEIKNGPLVIMVCMKLHNMCVEKNLPVPSRRHEDNMQPVLFEVLDNIYNNDGCDNFEDFEMQQQSSWRCAPLYHT